METPSQERRYDLAIAAIAIAATLVLLPSLRWIFTRGNFDIRDFYLHWYAHIVQYGRWRSLEGSYADYSPPYLYLLSFFTLLDGRLSPTVILKLVQVPGILASSFLAWSICRALGKSTRRSLLAAWIILIAPEVVEDALMWGQCDMIHTAWILLMLRLLIARRPGWAMASFGVALSFKLQAIFIGPLLVALFFTGEVPLWSLLCIPASYIAMLVPAALAGRPKHQLLAIYSSQYSRSPLLGMDVANFYQLLQPLATDRVHVTAWITRFALASAVLASLALILYLLKDRARLRGWRLLLAAAASLLMEPFLLPKMHDRYFFSGDVIVLILAMLQPRFALPALLLQASAVLVYYPFMSLQVLSNWFYVLPVAMTTSALWLIARIAFQPASQTSLPPSKSADSAGAVAA